MTPINLLSLTLLPAAAYPRTSRAAAPGFALSELAALGDSASDNDRSIEKSLQNNGEGRLPVSSGSQPPGKSDMPWPMAQDSPAASAVPAQAMSPPAADKVMVSSRGPGPPFSAIGNRTSCLPAPGKGWQPAGDPMPPVPNAMPAAAQTGKGSKPAALHSPSAPSAASASVVAVASTGGVQPPAESTRTAPPATRAPAGPMLPVGFGEEAAAFQSEPEQFFAPPSQVERSVSTADPQVEEPEVELFLHSPVDATMRILHSDSGFIDVALTLGEQGVRAEISARDTPTHANAERALLYLSNGSSLADTANRQASPAPHSVRSVTEKPLTARLPYSRSHGSEHIARVGAVHVYA